MSKEKEQWLQRKKEKEGQRQRVERERETYLFTVSAISHLSCNMLVIRCKID